MYSRVELKEVPVVIPFRLVVVFTAPSHESICSGGVVSVEIGFVK